MTAAIASRRAMCLSLLAESLLLFYFRHTSLHYKELFPLWTQSESSG